MNTMRKRSAAVLGGLLFALALPVRAEQLYRYVDEDGVVVITNVPPGTPKKALRMKDQGEVTRVVAPPPADARPARPTAEYEAHLAEACALYRIPVPLARAIMAAESSFNPRALSPKGAAGLMQLMPETAAEMFVGDVFDPKQNIHGGVRYLRILANQFNGDMVQIVAAYNAGPEAVRRAGGIPQFAETQEYVKRVLRLYFAYKTESNNQS